MAFIEPLLSTLLAQVNREMNAIKHFNEKTFRASSRPVSTRVSLPRFSRVRKDLPVRRMKLEGKGDVIEYTTKEDGLDNVTEVPVSKFFQIPHEKVSNVLIRGSTDKRLDSVFPVMNDYCDSLTPDFIIEGNTTYYVIEIGTCAAEMSNAIESSYGKKFKKYSMALENRLACSDKSIIYVPIIVSHSTVASSITFPRNLALKLCEAFRIGLSIVRSGEHLIEENECIKKPLEERVQDLMEYLSKIELEDTNPIKSASLYGFNKSQFKHYQSYKADKTVIDNSYMDFLNYKSPNQIPGNESANLMRESLDSKTADINNRNVRRDGKKPCVIPFFIPMSNPGTTPSFEHPVSAITEDGFKPVLELWKGVLSIARENTVLFTEDPEKLLEEAMLDDNEEVDSRMTEEKKTNRRKWHRCKVEQLSESTWQQLSLDGLHGKKYKSLLENKQKRRHQQKGFHSDTPTEDLESDLKKTPTELTTFGLFPGLSYAKELIASAVELSGSQKEGNIIVNRLTNTDFFAAFMMCSLVAQELLISLKQNVSSREFIYKRVRGTFCELIVHPTRSDSHVFFSLRFKSTKVVFPGFSPKLIVHGGWYYTELLSTNKSKLCNQIKAPFTWMNLMIHWMVRGDSNFSKQDLLEKYCQSGDHQELSLIGTFVSLEDKAQTEELITATRYIAMQFLKGNNSVSFPTPHNAIEKIPDVLRSRLAVLLFNRIKKYCHLQMENLPVFNISNFNTTNNELNTDNWANLIHPLLLTPCYQARILIDEFFLGYTKNKNEAPNDNSDFQMIKKILKYIMNEDQDSLKKGLYTGGSKPDLKKMKPHEWHIDILQDSIELAKEYLSSSLGYNYKHEIGRNILHKLVRSCHFEALATMKASALFENFSKTHNFTEEELIMVEQAHQENPDQDFISALLTSMKRSRKKKARTQHTLSQELDREKNPHLYNNSKPVDAKDEKKGLKKQCKCAESVVREIKTGDHSNVISVMKLDDMINSLRTEFGGVCCYLFKKNQHGGLREIYVLTFRSRLVQIFIETTFRTLCENFEEETMTHPESKLELMDRHNREVTECCLDSAGRIFSLSSSEDKQKWNQNINVNCLAFIAAQLLPEYLSKAVYKSLSLWRGKKILLPDGVKNMLNSGFKPKDNSEEFQFLYDEYWKNPDMLFENKGDNFMETRTGMWQGILHYSSSFLHILQTIHYKNMIETIIIPLMKSAGAVDCFVVTLVSSDDSFTKLSVVVPTGISDKGIHIIEKLSADALFAEEFHSSWFNMIESKKTVMASPTVGEFNSTFFIAEGMVNALIKSVIASTSINNTESIDDRQESYHNLLKDIYENGGGHYQSHLHQLVQALFHYSSMGIFVNALSAEWTAKLLVLQDPKLGFFLITPDKVSGLFNYNYTAYTNLVKSKAPLMMSKTQISKKIIDKEEGEIKDWLQPCALSFRIGDRKRWERFVKNVEVDHWREQIENNPSILYKQQGETLHEVRLRVSAKASSKGVFESLNTDDSIVSVFSASVYAISGYSITMRTMDFNSEESEVFKRSLLCLVDKYCTLLDKHETKEGSTEYKMYAAMPQTIKDVLFPNNHLYDAVNNYMEKISEQMVEKICKAFKQKKNKIHLHSSDTSEPIPLLDVCRKIWFNYDTYFGIGLSTNMFESYQALYPWLNLSPDKTLADGPFETHKNLYDFISSLTIRKPTISPLCRPFRSSVTTTQIIESIRFNHYPGVLIDVPKELKLSEEETLSSHVKSLKLFRNMLNYFLIFPEDSSEKLRVLKEIVYHTTIDFNMRYTPFMPDYLIPTYIFIRLLSNSMGVEDAIALLTRKGSGVLKLWFKEQTRAEKNKWVGHGVLYLKSKNAECIISVFDNFVVAIETVSISNLIKDWPMMQSELKQDGIQTHVIGKTKFKLNEKYIDPSRRHLIRTRPNAGISIKQKLEMSGTFKPEWNSIPVFQVSADRFSGVPEMVSQCSIEYEMHPNMIIVTLVKRPTGRYISEEREMSCGSGRVITLFRIHNSSKISIESDLNTYWPRPQHFTRTNTERVMLDWVYNDTTSPAVITICISELRKREENKCTKRIDKDTRSFLGEALKYRLINKSLLKSYLIDYNLTEVELTKKDDSDKMTEKRMRELARGLIFDLKMLDGMKLVTSSQGEDQKKSYKIKKGFSHEGASTSGSQIEGKELTIASAFSNFEIDSESDSDDDTTKDSDSQDEATLVSDNEEGASAIKADLTKPMLDDEKTATLLKTISALELEKERLEDAMEKGKKDKKDIWSEAIEMENVEERISKAKRELHLLIRKPKESVLHALSIKDDLDVALKNSPVLASFFDYKYRMERLLREQTPKETISQVQFREDKRPVPDYLLSPPEAKISAPSTGATLIDKLFEANTMMLDNLAYKSVRTSVLYEHSLFDDFIMSMGKLGLWSAISGNLAVNDQMRGSVKALCWLMDIPLPDMQIPVEYPFED